MTAVCEKGSGGKLRLRRSFPPPALSIMRGVISNEVRNLQNNKNDNLNGEALNAVKCTHTKKQFLENQIFKYFCRSVIKNIFP